MCKVIAGVVLGILLFVTPLFAYEEYGISKSVDTIGVANDLAYFTVVEGFNNNPLYGVLYVNLTTPGGRATLASLYIAKLYGQKIVRLIYNVGPGGGCYVTLLQTK